MDIHNATEQAYRNGYEAGKRDAEPKWIPVEERLPDAAPDPDESKDIVLVSFTFWDGGVYTTPAYHDGKNWHWWAADYGTLYANDVADTREATITHWMPLPNPPTK